MDEAYCLALNFCQASSRNGIDDALHFRHPEHNAAGQKLDGALVPVEATQTYQIAAQAGYPMTTIPAGVDKETGRYTARLVNYEHCVLRAKICKCH